MFIVAEISPQFGNDLFVAEQMILQAKMAGASAVKVQLYPSEMFFPEPVEPYIKSRDLTFEGFQHLMDYGKSIGMPVFATAFDRLRLQWCIDLDQPFFKIAARQHAEQPDLVHAILALGKPTFVSVPADIDLADLDVQAHCTYLSCIAQYPTLLEEVRLPDFENTIFSGISDHSVGMAAALMASAHGAMHLEKHFTIDHAWQRSDEKGHFGAMTYEQLQLIARVSSNMERIRASG